MIVVDASVLADAVLLRPSALDALAHEVRDEPDQPLHAPELIELETLSALRQMVMRGAIGDDRASAAVAALARVRLHRFPHEPLRSRVWELRHSLTPYDAAYLALAEVLDGVLMTADRGLASVAEASLGHSAVRLVG